MCWHINQPTLEQPANVIDYGQYQHRDVCPGCGRCRQCGRPAPEPIFIPSPFGPPTWPYYPWRPTIIYGSDSLTAPSDNTYTVWS